MNTTHKINASKAGLGSISPIGFGLTQGEWTHGPDLALLISGMSEPAPVNRLVVLLSGLPEEEHLHCCKVSAANKGCRVYPLDPSSDAVALDSGCTLVSPHKSLNTCRGVISEPDQLCNSDAEILEGFSDQGVVQRETETRSLTTPDTFNALSTETLPEFIPDTSNSEHSNAPENPQCIKRNSRNRRKCPKVQKSEIEIKMTPHRPGNAAPMEYATDDEDMITYDVEEKELEPDPTVKFTLKENPINYPKRYLRALTPTRFRKK
ncbi:hypothetical protein TNCV_3282391 [Trichonephila clavipes]|nr:hypothetical protein TNCV_3282391 [Trichonephila clavipes]